MAEAAHPDLVDLVNCAMCLERFNESEKIPKSLPCLHTFCVRCLTKSDTVRLGKISGCPTCRTDFSVPREGIESLPTNFMVLNLLNHVPEETGNQKPMKPTLCSVHTDKKCDFFCDTCKLLICHGCIVNFNNSEHKNHKIRELKDVLEELDTKIADIENLVGVMCIESAEKLKEIEKKLGFSRDALKRQTKRRLDSVVSDANKWYVDINSTIDKEFNKCIDQIHEAEQKVKDQNIQAKLHKVISMKNEGLIENVETFLVALNSALQEFKRSSLWPSLQWSASMGSISQKVTLDMGHLTSSQLKLPKMARFPFPEKPVVKLFCNTSLANKCDYQVGLTLSEAVVAYKDDNKLQKLDINSSVPRVISETKLPKGLAYYCRKFMLKDCVLLQERERVPSYQLDNDLNVLRTMQESYGTIIGADSQQWLMLFTSESLIKVNLKDSAIKRTVTPPSGITWSEKLSACMNPDNEALVVLDETNKILVIYDSTGNLLHICHLQFVPRTPHGVSCSRQHIYTASLDPPGVHIFSWQGELLTSMDRAQLGIPRGHYVWNIHGDGDKFVIATGSYFDHSLCVDSFKTYQCI